MARKTAKTDSNGVRKFGMLDKVAYAAGDFGCNMSFALAGTFFTLFYTQYMGIDSITFAGILVILKIWDAVNDPLIGAMVDSDTRKYKNGKFKAYISVGSIGLLVAGALCFLPFPNAPYAVRIILCVLGYIAWDACYTVVNVPYGAMISTISADSGDRAQLSAWRSLGATVAGFPVGVLLPVLLYDQNNELLGGRLFTVGLILGVMGLIAFRFMLHNTVQRVQLEPVQEGNKEKFNYLNALRNFFKNPSAVACVLCSMALYLGTYGCSVAITVMFQSYFQNASLSGLISMMSVLPMLLFMPFVRKLVTRWGKKEASVAGLFFSVIITLGMIVIPMSPDGSGVLIFLLLAFLNGVGMGVFSCVGNAITADVIDYNEWKHGVREEGTIYALSSFFRKLAQGLGPSLCLVLMVWLGYDEALGAAQPFEVAKKIRYLVAALYFFSSAAMWFCMKFLYKLDKKTVAEMEIALGRGSQE